jgi:hypothetical protein
MVDVRSGADVMFFDAGEQGKLLFFMKISLFIDIVIRVRSLGSAIIGANGSLTILKSRKIPPDFAWDSEGF